MERKIKPFASKRHMRKCGELVRDGKMSQELYDKILEATDVSELVESVPYTPRGIIRGYRREKKQNKNG